MPTACVDHALTLQQKDHSKSTIHSKMTKVCWSGIRTGQRHRFVEHGVQPPKRGIRDGDTELVG